MWASPFPEPGGSEGAWLPAVVGRRGARRRSGSECGAPGLLTFLKGRPPEPEFVVVSRHSRPVWQSDFLLLERVALRAGEGGCVMGNYVPPPAPPSIPPEHPFLGSRICSDLALARSIFRENRRVPQAARQAPPRPSFEHGTYLRAACKSRCFREKNSVPPARWAKLSAAKGRAVARKTACLSDG